MINDLIYVNGEILHPEVPVARIIQDRLENDENDNSNSNNDNGGNDEDNNRMNLPRRLNRFFSSAYYNLGDWLFRSFV